MSAASIVASADGTRIAFDRFGDGPPLILVGGAFSQRGWKGFVELGELLGDRFTVIDYDRRGRGESADRAPYGVARELEDLAAVVGAAGGAADVFGMSSGGVLALRAAAAGVDIRRLVVYQPPFAVDAGAHLTPPGFAERLDELLAAGRRSAAVSYFMREGMGAPRVFVSLLHLAWPIWSKLTAVAHTLPYDYAVMGETVGGRPLTRHPWASIAAPTLVLDGSKSPAPVGRAADALAAVMPDAQRHTLSGQSHNVAMPLLAAAIRQHLTRGRVPR